MEEKTQEQKTEPTPTVTESKPEKNVGMAVASYFLFFIPLLTDTKNDPFVKFHVKQALLLQVSFVVLSVLFSILPYYLYSFLSRLISIAFLILWILGLLNAINSKTKYLPVIGKYAQEWLKF